MGQILLEIPEDEENNSMRSRKKEDLWHIFNDIPLGKTCPVLAEIIWLLIHAIFVFCKEDYQVVTEFFRTTSQVCTTYFFGPLPL